jgi:hypothetical protein
VIFDQAVTATSSKSAISISYLLDIFLGTSNPAALGLAYPLGKYRG